MAKTKAQRALEPFLTVQQPNEKGEWDLHCPLPHHEDAKRSASINFAKGSWYCHGCQTGGSIRSLMVELERQGVEGFTPTNGKAKAERPPQPLPSDGTVHGWHAALLSNRTALAEFQELRGLNIETIVTYQLGWYADERVYTIPIRDEGGDLVNVRFYDPHPRDERRKIWGVEGHNTPVLYPIDQLVEDEIIICEGEWDALLAIQLGFPAITRTGAAKVWKANWNLHFAGKRVWLCHDADHAGRDGNRKVAMALQGVADELATVELPYPILPKNGKDLTDYFHGDHHSPEDFRKLLKSAAPWATTPSLVDVDMVDIGVLDSFDANAAGKALRMRVTITGKRNPPYLSPEQVSYRCTRDAGPKCAICPMNDLGGEHELRIDASDRSILEMLHANDTTVHEVLRKKVGAQKCSQLVIEATHFRAVEELLARPSVEIARISAGDAGDYLNRRLISVGRHSTMPNNTVEVVGTIYPNPKTQHNEFQAWEVVRTTTSVDRFEMTDEVMEQLRVFQPRPGQRPLNRVADIAKDHARHVTKIYGRNEMHAALDLVWHSILEFEFGGQLIQRGWMDLLVVGDTRTGKSEAAMRLLGHYDAGEMVSCESASFAGIVGGLQQVGGGKEWEVTWGAIPLNDRRLVVMDEVGGLRPEEIAQLSSIRSSGEAQLTKIRSERTLARTRLVWLGNPREARMADFTYGVQAIRPLIGNNEDIARFDLALTVAADEVDPEEINQEHVEADRDLFPEAACQALVLWAWSRRADQVAWSPGAQDAVYAAALDLGATYVETPPLIQAANVRVKVARLAVALAARTFSTEDGETLLVRPVHVTDAVRFMNLLYGKPSFGYREWSRDLLEERREAARNYDDAKQYVGSSPGLARFLRKTEGSFRMQDLQDMLLMDRDMANAVVNKLWEMRMVTRQAADIKLQPLLHDILREVR